MASQIALSSINLGNILRALRYNILRQVLLFECLTEQFELHSKKIYSGMYDALPPPIFIFTNLLGFTLHPNINDVTKTSDSPFDCTTGTTFHCAPHPTSPSHLFLSTRLTIVWRFGSIEGCIVAICCRLWAWQQAGHRKSCSLAANLACCSSVTLFFSFFWWNFCYIYT